MIDDADSRARARVGAVLDDKWTLERLLGVGGMAAVYAARHRNGATAAVKLLHPDLARHKEVRERFLREGYAANRVAHPGAVKVLDDDVVANGPEAGTAYLVMELLEGQSMQDRLELGAVMCELEFLRIAAAVLDVLRAAHANGVVHRDLKPENLFLVKAEMAAATGATVKILDFGLARLLDGQAITTYGLALGTPSFMSPEQAAGRLDEIDGRTDLFALAATGFRVRTGRRIHEAGNAVELVTKMANLPAPPIRTVAPDVSEPYARVVDRALAFRRDDRYEDAEAMLRDVERARAELDAGEGPTHYALPSQRPAAVVRANPASDRPAAPDPPPPPDRKAPVLPPPAVRADPSIEREPTTLEVSRRDLESTAPPVRRRRGSLLPWVAVLLFGGIGARLYLDSRGSEGEDAVAPRGSIAPPGPTSAGVHPASSEAAELTSTSASASEPSTSASSSSAGSTSSSALPFWEGAPSAAAPSASAPSASAPSSAAPASAAPASAPPSPPAHVVQPTGTPGAGASSGAAHAHVPAQRTGPGNVHKLTPHKHHAGTTATH